MDGLWRDGHVVDPNSARSATNLVWFDEALIKLDQYYSLLAHPQAPAEGLRQILSNQQLQRGECAALVHLTACRVSTLVQ